MLSSAIKMYYENAKRERGTYVPFLAAFCQTNVAFISPHLQRPSDIWPFFASPFSSRHLSPQASGLGGAGGISIPRFWGQDPDLVPDPNRLGGHLLAGHHCEA
jgi:hypothetical protein